MKDASYSIIENCELCRRFGGKTDYKCKLCKMRVCRACLDGWQYACRRCNPGNEQIEPTVPLTPFKE